MSAVIFNNIFLEDVIAIIPAFYMNIGSQDFQKNPRIVFPENEGAIDRAQRPYDKQTIMFILQRSAGAFKPLHNHIGIYSNREYIA